MTAVENPAELQTRNRKIVQGHLEQAYAAVDGMIRKSYARHDMGTVSLLRNLRSNINNLLPEIRSSGLDSFHSRKGTLNEFYASEKCFIDSSERFSQAIASSTEPEKDIDIFNLQQSFSALQRNFRERISASDDLIQEFRISTGSSPVIEPVKKPSSTVGAFGIRRETATNSGTSSLGQNMGVSMGNTPSGVIIEPDGRELAPHMLASLYNYFNLLEQKYSTNHPEISANDEYIGNRKWVFEKGDRYIRGDIYDNLFSRTMTFYIVFKPYDEFKKIAESVQKEGDKVPSGQYLSLCVVGAEWPEDIINWAASFFHVRMSLFIYDIGTGVFCFNKDLKLSNRFAFWHNMDKEMSKLYDRLYKLLQECGSLSVTEASKGLGLEQKSTEEYFKKLLKAGVLVDVGFGEHKYALTRSKLKSKFDSFIW